MVGRFVKVGDGHRQWGHELDAQGAGRCQSIEQCLLRESMHLDEPVNGPAVSPERKRSVILAGNGDHATIERWRRPLIEANFGLAQRAAPLGR